MEEVYKHAFSKGRTASRAKAFEDEFFQRRATSALADLLISSWVWGHISATMVQKVAQAAKQDVESSGISQKIWSWEILSQLGTAGANPQNIRRDLERKLPAPLCQCTSFMVPLRLPLTGGRAQVGNVQLPILLPETSFNNLWKNKDAWKEMILPRPEELEMFWSAVCEHPCVINHPMKNLNSWSKRCIPLALHGDGASVTQQIGSGSKSCLFISYRSLMASSGKSKNKHILIAAAWTHHAAKDVNGFNTDAKIWSIIANSFKRILQSEGQSTGGFIAVPCFSTGDLEYFSSWHRCPHWTSAKPCSLCSISSSNLADYRNIPLPPEDPWNLPRNHACPLFQEILSPSSISPDWLHTKHLGIDQRLIGSVGWVILQHLFTEGSLEERCGSLLKQLKEVWSNRKMQGCLTNLTVKMLMTDKNATKKYPKLKAKAYETKQCLVAFLEVWTNAMDAGCQAHEWVKLALSNSLRMDEIIDQCKEDFKLNPSAFAELTQCAKNYTLLNIALHKWYSDKGLRLFQVGTMKGHWLHHSVALSRFINPYLLQRYSGKDFMSVMKTLLHACLNGRTALSALRHFRSRYILAFTYEVAFASRTWRLK